MFPCSNAPQDCGAAAGCGEWAKPERGFFELAVDGDELNFQAGRVKGGEIVVAHAGRYFHADRRGARVPAPNDRYGRLVIGECEHAPASATASWVEEDRLGVGRGRLLEVGRC